MNRRWTLFTSLAYSWNGWWVMTSIRCIEGGTRRRASCASWAKAQKEKSWHQHWHTLPQQQVRRPEKARDTKSPPLRRRRRPDPYSSEVPSPSSLSPTR
ncbi:hypothetical protein ACHAWF_003066 [Thalassiosira exigua]